MVSIAVLDDYQKCARALADWSGLERQGAVTFFADPIPPGELSATLAGYDIVVLNGERSPFGRDVIEALPGLRFVVWLRSLRASKVPSVVDMDLLHERGIPVSGTEGLGVSMTEVTWALILSAVKRIAVEDRALRAGHWQTGMPANLYGTTLGLAGLGVLGARMVPVARAFGMDIIAWSQNLTDERAAEAGVERVSKAELLGRSDVLSIHLVLSDRTVGTFGQAEFALMKPSAVLVNTSRGPIVEEQALIEALRNGQIGGAGLDVYWSEPLDAGHPLLALDNVVLSPHFGYVSDRSFRHVYSQIVEDIEAFLNGSPVRLM